MRYNWKEQPLSPWRKHSVGLHVMDRRRLAWGDGIKPHRTASEASWDGKWILEKKHDFTCWLTGTMIQLASLWSWTLQSMHNPHNPRLVRLFVFIALCEPVLSDLKRLFFVLHPDLFCRCSARSWTIQGESEAVALCDSGENSPTFLEIWTKFGLTLDTWPFANGLAARAQTCASCFRTFEEYYNS